MLLSYCSKVQKYQLVTPTRLDEPLTQIPADMFYELLTAADMLHANTDRKRANAKARAKKRRR
jgi:hypothetical protein